MVEYLDYLWSMITVFFSEEVFSNNLFLGLLVLTSVFAVVHILLSLLDSRTWGW